MSSRADKIAMNFKTMQQTDVPQGRNGKHREIVGRILSDLDQTRPGMAIKVPLAELDESKEKGEIGAEPSDAKSRTQRRYRER